MVRIVCLTVEYLAEDICSETSVRAYTGNGEVLTSPNYPQDYPNNRTCHLNISTGSTDLCIKVDINHLDMELNNSGRCEYDSLSIYDGYSNKILEKVCGYELEAKRLIFNTSKITLLFTTDASWRERGFNLTYAAVFCQGSEYMYSSSSDVIVTV